jgi:hypothetical protein
MPADALERTLLENFRAALPLVLWLRGVPPALKAE